jgi:hypothetical protein
MNAKVQGTPKDGENNGAGIPLAAPLPSIDSAGVTHAFADFFQVGTTSASDSSKDCCGSRLAPSRPCLRPNFSADPSEVSRFPCMRRFGARSPGPLRRLDKAGNPSVTQPEAGNAPRRVLCNRCDEEGTAARRRFAHHRRGLS